MYVFKINVAALTSIFLLLGHTALAQSQLERTAAVARNPEIDRSSIEYRDFDWRLRQSVKGNSIALLMLRDSLQSGSTNGSDVVAILEDHRNRVSAVESFRSGRHSVSFKGHLDGRVGTGGLARFVPGVDFGLSGAVDLELIRNSGALLQTSGRIQTQTGADYVVGDAAYIAKACGSVGGDGSAPISPIIGIEISASGQTCYEYQPNGMTALAGYVAKNQLRLTQLEQLQGDDLLFLTDRLFAHASSQCDRYYLPAPTPCGAIQDHISNLDSAGLGIGIPKNIRSKEEIRSKLMDDPTTALLVEQNEETLALIAKLEEEIGRDLNNLEKGLLTIGGDINAVGNQLNNVQKELLRQGRAMDILSDPVVQEKLLTNAMIASQKRLKQHHEREIFRMRMAPYATLSDSEKEKKFADSVKVIAKEHSDFNSYSEAARSALLLVGALSDNPKFQGQVQKAFQAINAVNSLVKHGRIISSAYSAGKLASSAALGAYTGGVGAALILVDLFSSGGGKSELAQVLEHIDKRFDRVEEQLRVIIEQNVILDRKLDAILAGQEQIAQTIIQNARSIRANRTQLLFIRASVENLANDLQALSFNIFRLEEFARYDRYRIFSTLVEIEKENTLGEVRSIFRTWIGPNSDVISKLNDGSASADLVRDVRREQSTIVEVLDDLSGPKFILPAGSLTIADTASNAADLYISMAQLPGAATDINLINDYIAKHRTGPNDTLLNLLPDGERKDSLRIQSDAFHSAAYPQINITAFQRLPNPEALALIFEGYLTFVLSLNPEARERVGFPYLKAINEQIERLKNSREEARKAAFSMISVHYSSLPAVATSTARQRISKPLFQSRLNELQHYVLRPESLNNFSGFTDLAEAEDFAKSVASDREMLTWIKAYGHPYVVRTLRQNPQHFIKMVDQLLVNSTSWRLEKINDSETSSYVPSLSDIEWYNQELLSAIRAMGQAYEQGDLSEIGEDDLNLLDKISTATTVELTPEDLEKFVSLIHSNKQLVRFALAENMASRAIVPVDETADINGDLDGKSSVYGFAKHLVYHKGKETWKDGYEFFGKFYGDKNSATYSCYGADVELTNWGRQNDIDSPKFAFPIDSGGALWPVLVESVGNAIVQCVKNASKQSRSIPHTIPAGRYYGEDFAAIPKDPRESSASFLRNMRVVADKTKLFHRGRARCSINIEWQPEMEEMPSVNVAVPLGRTALYVIETIDSPLRYTSKTEVDRLTKNWYADDGSPLTDGFQKECFAYDMTAMFSTHPGSATLGQPVTSEVIKSGWKILANDQLELQSGTRTAILTQLKKRLVSTNDDGMEKAGKEFRNSAGAVGLAITRMESVSREGSDISIAKIRDAIELSREYGPDAFFGHPTYTAFVRDYPKRAQRVEAFRRFVDLEKKHADLIQSFAVWGLGSCIGAVPAYRNFFEVLYPTESGYSLPLAYKIMNDESATGRYVEAMAVIASAAEKLGNHRELIKAAGFNADIPEEYQPSYSYAGLDHELALSLAEGENCIMGNTSIQVLEDLQQLANDLGVF